MRCDRCGGVFDSVPFYCIGGVDFNVCFVCQEELDDLDDE
jgi:hypothetical protein